MAKPKVTSMTRAQLKAQHAKDAKRYKRENRQRAADIERIVRENAVRLAAANNVSVGRQWTRADFETAVTDLLSNIRHFCDIKALAFSELDNCAYGHYVAEVVQARTGVEQ